MLRYPIGDSGQILVITERVLNHFDTHRQLLPHQPEAGGQLFARFDGAEVIIEHATGPRRKDRRGRAFYYPDHRSEQREIEQMYRKDLHFIGDWHTHPSILPEPSHTDLSSIRQSFRKSHHELNGFILIVVGTADGIRRLRVSLIDGAHDYELQPLAS